MISDAAFVDIAVRSGSDNNPAVLYINKTNNKPYFAKLNGSSWSSTKISDNATREIKGAFASDGKLVAVYIGNTSSYQGYYALYSNSFGELKKDTKINTDMSAIDIATDGSTLYVGYSWRDTEHYGPIVKKGTIGSNSVNFQNDAQFTQPFTEGKLIHSVSIAVREGNVFAIIDDNSRVSMAQSHTYRLDGNAWKVYGENELPYFKVTFYNSHSYYLRGYAPDIAVASDNKVYISMTAWENAGGRNANFGPLVMQYVADSWTVH